MDPIYIIINGCLFVSVVMFFIKRIKGRAKRAKEIAVREAARHKVGQTPLRKPLSVKPFALHYAPAHFDGVRHNVENALSREAILFGLTRNPTRAVAKPPEDDGE